MAITVSKPRSPSVLAQVRALMPLRRLTQSEALRITELQAARLLELSGVTHPPVPEGLITGLPRVKVERTSPLPMSGYTDWEKGSWLIVLNHAEPLTRQRFTLFHEAKHVLDHPFIAEAYGEDWAERICDQFSASVLMPKAWVKRSYCHQGMQQLPTLARQFGVSQVAMRTRLLDLGLIEPTPRCRYRRASDAHLMVGLAVAA